MREASKPPEEWIDQQVVVSFPSPQPAQLIARLDGISDWGVTLTPEYFRKPGFRECLLSEALEPPALQ